MRPATPIFAPAAADAKGNHAAALRIAAVDALAADRAELPALPVAVVGAAFAAAWAAARFGAARPQRAHVDRAVQIWHHHFGAQPRGRGRRGLGSGGRGGGGEPLLRRGLRGGSSPLQVGGGVLLLVLVVVLSVRCESTAELSCSGHGLCSRERGTVPRVGAAISRRPCGRQARCAAGRQQRRVSGVAEGVLAAIGAAAAVAVRHARRGRGAEAWRGRGEQRGGVGARVREPPPNLRPGTYAARRRRRQQSLPLSAPAPMPASPPSLLRALARSPSSSCTRRRRSSSLSPDPMPLPAGSGSDARLARRSASRFEIRRARSSAPAARRCGGPVIAFVGLKLDCRNALFAVEAPRSTRRRPRNSQRGPVA